MTEPPPPTTFRLDLSRPVTAIQVGPGGEIVLRGSYHSRENGSTIDASTTTWTKDHPGGASVDPGGILDLKAGGFHVTSRDPVTHEVHAVASGGAAPACDLAHVAAPCLPLRYKPAPGSYLTSGQWFSQLEGAIAVEVVAPPAYAPAVAASRQAMPFLAGAGALVALALGGVALWKFRKKQASSPRAQLIALARAVQAKARQADPALAAPLGPALAGAMRRLEGGAIDPTSAEGQRVRVMLEKVDSRLEEAAQRSRSQREQEIADELAHEVEVAFAAAEEAHLAERG